MKLALVPIALAVGLSMSACGSDDTDASDAGAPAAVSESTASTESAAGGAASDPFCEALVQTATLEDGKDVAALRESLESTGLPAEAGEQAGAGLEVYLDLLGQVEPDATAEDLATMADPDLTKEEQADVDAMVEYATTACASGAGQNSETPESPSESPSESPAG